MKIQSIGAIEILDSRGNPTIEVDLILQNGFHGSASVPSGASKGSKEALELRDNDNRYHGKGIKKAINNVYNKVAPVILNKDFETQSSFDDLLNKTDGTDNKSNIGGNAMLAVSLAFADAMSKSEKMTLAEYIGILFDKEEFYQIPVPLINMINGGKHADNGLNIQEFMIAPMNFNQFSDAIEASACIFYNLKDILKSKKFSTNVGDEGGFAPNINNTNQAIELLLEAIEKANYKAGKDIFIALDVAANELYRDNFYFIDGKKYNNLELNDFYINLTKQYPIFSIEDPFAESDLEGFKTLTNIIGNKIQIVGDDLFVTNAKLINDYMKEKTANTVLIKPNQIGTLTETLNAIQMAKSLNAESIISHRSGETEDVKIAHISVGTPALQIKTGSLSRTDRIAKYNELLRLEKYFGKNAKYAGNSLMQKLKIK